MVRLSWTLRVAALAIPVLAFGCAAPPPPPLVDIASHACADKPDLISAKPVPLGDPLRPSVVKVRVDNTAPCLKTAQGDSLYAAFRLPDSLTPYMIVVRSTPLGEGLLVPRLMLLDGTGTVTRELGQDSLQFRADTLTALTRSHPGELYLVVAATPRTVGETKSRITETTLATTYSSGGGFFTIHSGSDATRTYVFAQDGLISVYAAHLPKVGVQ
jgi:hypothetical protein